MKRSKLRKTPKPKSNSWYRKKCVERAKIEAKERDKYICQRCGKDGNNGYKIDGSHVFPEGHYHGMSAMAENIKAMCFQCHKWWHSNPIDAHNWFKAKFPERYKTLKALSLKTIQINWRQEYEQPQSGLKK